MKKNQTREERRIERRAFYQELSDRRQLLAERQEEKEGVDRKLAYKLASGAANLYVLLRKGCVTFHYLKEKERTKRKAFGTLCEEASDDYAMALETMRERNPNYNEKAELDKLEQGLLTYYDLEKNGWRTFKVKNLLYVGECTTSINKTYQEL
jgi:hypothetical protein